MKKLAVAVILLSVLETVVCGFGLGILVAYISRILFIGKMIGMKIKVGLLIGLEVLGLGFYVLIPIIFKGNVSVLSFIMFILGAIMNVALVLYDDYAYVYVEEEEE